MATTYDELPFSEDWNGGKLGCKYFTTIRLHNPRKYRADKVMTVLLKKKIYSNAKIIEVMTVRFDQIKPWLKMLDTGYDEQEFDKMFHTMYKNIVKDWNTQLWDIVVCRNLGLDNTEKYRFDGVERKLEMIYYPSLELHNPSLFIKTGVLENCKHGKPFGIVKVADLITITYDQLKPWLKRIIGQCQPADYDLQMQKLYADKVSDWHRQKWDLILFKTIEKYNT